MYGKSMGIKKLMDYEVLYCWESTLDFTTQHQGILRETTDRKFHHKNPI
jgi:hypothetical protein